MTAQTAESAAAQFGYNCDYVGLVPLPGYGGRRALLVTNHEFTNEELMFPAGFDAERSSESGWSRTACPPCSSSAPARAAAASWKPVAPVDSAYNRRITGDTAFRFDGPAAGSDLLRTTADPAGISPRGTLNNCAGGMTPWGRC